MNNFFRWRSRGIPLGKINYLMAGVTVLLSALLLLATYRTGVSFTSLRDTTDQYIELKNSASDMQVASDYLTEQVRCFVETGEREYLDNYFQEANVTRRRDKALEALGEAVGESAAYEQLKNAMSQSVTLMNREYYAMRLTIAAYGYDLTQFPQVIQDVQLDGIDARLPQSKQSEVSRRVVFDEEYRTQKAAISQSMDQCLEILSAEMDARQMESSNALRGMLRREQTLIILLIGITLTIVLLTSLLIISPLLRAVLHIRGDQLIPVRGSYEFRFLAQTYNLMYEVNRESKEQLAYEASHDKLTGLYNRGGYDFIMENTDLADCALLLVDVDNFKHINDTYGHEMGDRALVWVTSEIRRCFRAQDYMCRLGGDEFAVIMRAVDAENADLIREKVGLINERLAKPADDLPQTSISVGVAFGSAAMSPQTLFEAADETLYRVKANGRRGCAFQGA